MTQRPLYILAPYVPTAPDVVERMLNLAEIGPTDLVYDIGCGDGRLAIAAARRGARAVGIDLEAYWVEQARAAAHEAGVGARVEFLAGDALDHDLSAASVLLVYLLDWSVAKVTLAARAQCQPGTRLISNSFAFPDPDAITQRFVDASGQWRQIHRWDAPRNPD
jgi:SAM-dependent methyltransferase